ncbi:MAG: RNA 2',3'-cyclic phosphodiesterase [Deltaproteobacteria bacterium]|nr:RNA 2',3'-cyclic phosphodiesterase [Deltaproteobacteria bacterium]
MADRTIRVFIAVPLPEELRAALATAASEAFGRVPAVRAVPARNLHATLRFLGPIDASAVEALGRGLRAVAARYEPFDLPVVGLGGFLNAREPRVIYATVGGNSGPLVAMAKDADLLAAKYGVTPETRPYTPHLTVARVKPGKTTRHASQASGDARRTRIRSDDGARDRALPFGPRSRRRPLHTARRRHLGKKRIERSMVFPAAYCFVGGFFL